MVTWVTSPRYSGLWIMRLFPELSIVSPVIQQVERCMEFIFSDSHPKYLRLRKAGENCINL